jgi:hypothetical protein
MRRSMMSRSERCREVMLERWSGRRAYWRELLERQAGSGLSISGFCAQEGVHVTSFYEWRRKLNANPAKASASAELTTGFVRVDVELPGLDEGDSGVSVALAGGAAIRLMRGFDPATLREVLSICGEGV